LIALPISVTLCAFALTIFAAGFFEVVRLPTM
jgi:hypothetical protein